MNLIREVTDGPRTGRPIYLICVFRNETALLEYFMEYYRALGVTHFIMIDNLSDDDGPEMLASLRGLNLSLYRAAQSYRDADYGVKWINHILETRCRGEFCLVVDADELLVLDSRRYSSLADLVSDMVASDANVMTTNLVDMYPEELSEPYEPGTDFRLHSPYFDDWNPTYYSRHHRIYGQAIHKVGGMRQRVFGARVCIHNFPLFRYDFYPIGLAPGRHYFQRQGARLRSADEIRLHPFESLLLHFKFLRPDFRKFVEERIRNNQDWNDSAEYRAYLHLLDGTEPLQLYDPKYSKRYTSIEDMDCFLNVPAELADAAG